jgi:hypothetical protein
LRGSAPNAKGIVMQVNVGYAYGQLVRAREKGDARGVSKWQAVIDGMRTGTINVGSRTPTKAPAWVTLDVVTGGFATGGYAAGGAFTAHEQVVATTRLGANLHYLEASDALLASGHYRIDFVEEGALLVCAWLRARGEHDRAAALVETIAPWFPTLRFFPAPAAKATASAETVRLQDVSTTITQLQNYTTQDSLDLQRDAELVWKPLRDRAIARWIETVDGELPRVVNGAVIGGYPGRVFPEGWRAWVHALVSECRAVTQPKTARAQRVIELVESLARLATHPSALDARVLGRVRREIAEFVTAYGVPGSERFLARRLTDARAVAAPLHADLRPVLIDRLRAEGDGIDLDRVSAPVSVDEATQHRVPAGAQLPWYMIAKAARSWDAPIETLAERGLLPSAEVLARVLPQLTAHVRAQGLGDEPGRRLYAAIYRAFRRRRGLLLLNYASQVRFHELPWVAAMENARSDVTTQAVRASLARATGAAVRAFPHTITPNKLVTELYAFAAAAKVEMPLVEELAADIFMGSFTAKFAEAAKVSARVIEGTLYQRYYAIDTFAIARLGKAKLADDFAALCQRRAGPSKGWGVAQNGKILEQCQILTTHNLAVLFERLALGDTLAPHLRAAAEQCFRFIVRQLRMPGGYRDQLHRLKNAAYAWRQMTFYLSFVDDPADFAVWARARIAHCNEPFRTRFEPALRGLELAIAGTWSTWAGFAAGGGRVFTGWSTERHWLMPAQLA